MTIPRIAAATDLRPLPAQWECAHGISEDEPFCAEPEDEQHECPTIRVHPDDAEKFAALVDQVHQLRSQRDAWGEWADTLAYKVAPVEVLGTHEKGQFPWSDALDMLTPAAEVDQLRAELERWKQTALRLAENAHLIPKLAGPIATGQQPVQQAVTATSSCGCRRDQGCTCPYPAEEEQ